MEPLRKELPEKWYVLYRTKEEFDLINKHYEKGWTYYDGDCYGYACDDGDDNWIDFSDRHVNIAQERVERNNLIQITFEEFRILVLGETDPRIFMEPAIDGSYLINLFQRLNIWVTN